MHLNHTSKTDSRSSGALKVYPAIAAAALRHGHARGLDLWHIARMIDKRGQGRVTVDELCSAAAGLGLGGWRGSQFDRALARAKDIGLLREVMRRRDGVRVIEIRSVLHVAKLYELESIGAFPVEVDPSTISKLADWRAALWAAFLEGARAKHRPMSQKVLRALSGVPESTQRVRNKRAHVVTTQNIAVDPSIDYRNKDKVHEVMEHHANVFAVNDVVGHRLIVAWSLPATYSTDLDRTKRGNTRKINSALRVGLANNAAGQQTKAVKRLYWDDTEKCVKQTLRDLEPRGRGAKRADAPAHRYAALRLSERTGAQIWQAF